MSENTQTSGDRPFDSSLATDRAAVAAAGLTAVRFEYSTDFPGILKHLGSALAITTYQAGKLAVILEKGEWSGELHHLTRDKKTVIMQSRWTLVSDADGFPKSIMMINTDVSERKQIEAQFLRTQRMESIGTLAGGIAHDLNNVLAPILMSVEILKEKFQDDQKAKNLAATGWFYAGTQGYVF